MISTFEEPMQPIGRAALNQARRPRRDRLWPPPAVLESRGPTAGTEWRDFRQNAAEGAASRAPFVYSGGRIRTCDLRVMSPTSYRTAPPRVVVRMVPQHALPDARRATMPPMRVAAADIGTNSTRLLVADVEPTARSPRSSGCPRSRASARASTPAARSRRGRSNASRPRSHTIAERARARGAGACSRSRRAPCAMPPTATTSWRASPPAASSRACFSGDEEAATTFAGVARGRPATRPAGGRHAHRRRRRRLDRARARRGRTASPGRARSRPAACA